MSLPLPSKATATPAAPAISIAVALATIAALWGTLLSLHLTPALFTALLTFGGTRALARSLLRWRPGLRYSQVWALALMLALLGTLGAVLIERVAEATAVGGGYLAMIEQMATVLEQLRGLLPPWLAAHLPASVEAVRETAVGWLREHITQLQLWGGHTARGIGYALAGIVIGAMVALHLLASPTARDGQAPLAIAMRRGFDGLVEAFGAVVFAQIRIALVNTVLTAVYLLGVLPLLGMPLPWVGTLVAATFVASLLPVVGNLVSNTVIVVLSLTHSIATAGLSLAWLVIIHKLEYFLNAQIIGIRIRASAWEILVVMIVLEAIFGLAGLVSAAIIYAQVKNTLRERGWL
jgi:predicted PurR-regulated permease PerM